jgi:hypothetical protein
VPRARPGASDCQVSTCIGKRRVLPCYVGDRPAILFKQPDSVAPPQGHRRLFCLVFLSLTRPGRRAVRVTKGMRVSLCALITWITLAESGLPVFQYVTMTKTHPMLMRHDRIAIGSRLRGGTPVDVEARTEKMKESATFDIVILGGGVAAGYCVKEMIAKGIGSSKVCILTEETCPPYERPALTKGYMLGALPSPHSGGFLCNPSDAYTAQGVEVLTSCKATRIDFENRLITTEYAPSDRSEKVSTTILYKKLVLATGADVERLFVPGNTLANIFYIRSSHIRFCSVEVLGWFGR